MSNTKPDQSTLAIREQCERYQNVDKSGLEKVLKCCMLQKNGVESVYLILVKYVE